jgi:hypothetical protein
VSQRALDKVASFFSGGERLDRDAIGGDVFDGDDLSLVGPQPDAHQILSPSYGGLGHCNECQEKHQAVVEQHDDGR